MHTWIAKKLNAIFHKPCRYFGSASVPESPQKQAINKSTLATVWYTIYQP